MGYRMTWLKNLPLRLKLIVLVVPCIIVILMLLGDRVRSDVLRYNEMKQVLRDVELLHIIAPILNEMQKERGRSTVYLADTNTQDRSIEALRNQYRDSGVALTALLTSENIKDAPDIRDLVSDIPNLRQRVLRNDLTSLEAFDTYTHIITILMKQGDRILQVSDVPDIMRHVGAYTAISWLTEIAGRERAKGSAYIRRAKHNQAELLHLVKLDGQQEAWQESVYGFLMPHELYYFEVALKSQENSQFINLRSEIGFLQTPKIAADEWFVAATSRIEVFSESKKRLLDLIFKDAESLKRDAELALIFGISTMILLFILALGMLIAFTREAGGQIKAMLSEMHTTMGNKKYQE